MIYLDALKLLNQDPIFVSITLILPLILLLIIGIKIEKKKELLDLILQRTAEVLALSLIPIVISILSLTNFAIAFVLSLIVVIIETKEDKSPLLYEIENTNISNLGKIIAEILLGFIPSMLSWIILFYFIFPLIFPIGTILTNIITAIVLVNSIIMLLDIMFAPAFTIINETEKLDKKAKMIKINKNNG